MVTESGTESIRLSSRQSHDYDVWAMQFFPYGVDGGKHYKLSELATVEKGQMPQQIAKENQQYRLCLQYEYIGSYEQGNKIQKRDLEEFNNLLPMGYTAESDSQSWSWGKKDNKQYLLLLVVIAIIFFTTSILFNSLKQPLAIIFVIPVSYIGVFLTFYWFRLNFDQGGFASFGVDNDSAGYCAPQGMRNILLISATPYQWKHMIRQRTCRRNTRETRYVMMKIWEELLKQNGELFSDCGPFCMNGGCEEGKMTCGKNIPNMMLPTDIIRTDFPKVCDVGLGGRSVR